MADAQKFIYEKFPAHVEEILVDSSSYRLSGSPNLSKYANLASFWASHNDFDNLNFLDTLPNKEKIKRLGFWGNKIKTIDFSWVANNFPNLETLSLTDNPLEKINLTPLSKLNLKNFYLGLSRSGSCHTFSFQGGSDKDKEINSLKAQIKEHQTARENAERERDDLKNTKKEQDQKIQDLEKENQLLREKNKELDELPNFDEEPQLVENNQREAKILQQTNLPFKK